ncbi:hypothetical protein DEJ49_13760 [Streptomyces venezuelae]|uniref:Resolvase/invertase-type recombinase catalytic domain-containing protein n=1 Tax=Streptomyces venezuelae TaxID=54571 RepID=A0A5P2CGJ8_STRVZ|nr:hypothetical protein [Streptomyces venezuelae]QES41924.1 hypothetical protein DEJ49_13760 [Streptomyces venezuelae]
MVSSERDQGQEPCAARRTEGQLRRRQGLADASAGVTPGETGVPAVVARIERFRCVIYLSGAAGADIAAPRRECTQYAAAFGWEITEVIEEHVGLLPPHGRAGLGQALDRIKAAEAGAVLTAWRSMISSVAQEYDEVAREIEKAGGFLHVRDSARSAEGTGR